MLRDTETIKTDGD